MVFVENEPKLSRFYSFCVLPLGYNNKTNLNHISYQCVTDFRYSRKASIKNIAIRFPSKPKMHINKAITILA